MQHLIVKSLQEDGLHPQATHPAASSSTRTRRHGAHRSLTLESESSTPSVTEPLYVDPPQTRDALRLACPEPQRTSWGARENFGSGQPWSVVVWGGVRRPSLPSPAPCSTCRERVGRPRAWVGGSPRRHPSAPEVGSAAPAAGAETVKAKNQDSDDDEEDTKKPSKAAAKKKGKAKNQDSDDDEEDTKKPSKAAAKKKGKAKNQDSDDDEEEDAKKPSKAAAKKKGKNKNHDSDDDEEEDTKKPSKAAAKKKGKNKNQDSDDDEEEDTKKPAKARLVSPFGSCKFAAAFLSVWKYASQESLDWDFLV